MKRSSPYYPLKYRVDCNMTGRFFETIAAFNSDRIALDYVANCRKFQARVGSPYTYRVMERTGKGWIEITKASR